MEILDGLKKNWSEPRQAFHGEVPCPFLLHCSFEPPISLRIAEVTRDVPSDVLAFWTQANGADLFIDGTYGQWGLQILSNSSAEKETESFLATRSKDARPGDLVLGKFYGDSDLLIIRSLKEARDFGEVIVAMPCDSRQNWPVVARSFKEFLSKFTKSNGAKYWEAQ